MPTIAGIWVVPTPDEDAPEDAPAGVLRKAAGSRAYFAFDFGNFAEVAAGDTIASAAQSVSPSGPTVGTAVTAGYLGETLAPYRVAAWYEAGSAGTDYTVTCTATLTSGTILVGKGLLRVV